MSNVPLPPFSCFDGHRLVASGTPDVAALALRQLRADAAAGPLLVFDNATGLTRDFDTRGSVTQLLARIAQAFPTSQPYADVQTAATDEPVVARGRGRPKLGVVAREVTLLPRHWTWLAGQPGGASVALRKLVEQARRDNEARDEQRLRQEAAYRFMSSMAGNLASFEDATRALYADDRERFAQCIATWPQDVRAYAMGLAWPAPD